LEDQKRSGRPSATNDDLLEEIIKNDPRCTTKEIAALMGTSHMTVWRHLKKLGYVNRYDVWVPHSLTVKNRLDRMPVCDSLLKRNEEHPFTPPTLFTRHSPSRLSFVSIITKPFWWKNLWFSGGCWKRPFFSSSTLNPKTFWRRGIMNLPMRWAKVVESNGDYFLK